MFTTQGFHRVTVSVPGISFDEDYYRLRFGDTSVDGRYFLNIGAGGFKHPCWHAVDHTATPYSRVDFDIDWNAESVDPMPFPDGIIEIVYSSHAIEHFTDKGAENFMREAFRVLKPGGLIRITCPDADLAVRAIMQDDPTYFYWSFKPKLPNAGTAPTEQRFLSHIATRCSEMYSGEGAMPVSTEELRERFARDGAVTTLEWLCARAQEGLTRKMVGHVNWWTWNKISSRLTMAGFVDVTRSGFGQSSEPVMRDTTKFDNTHPNGSLYVESRKPA